MVALALVALIIWPFFKPAVWALAVVVSIWRFRQRQMEQSRAKWMYSPAAMTLWAGLCLLIPFGMITGAITVEATSAATKLADPAQRELLTQALQEKIALVTPYLDSFDIAPEELPAKAAAAIGPRMGTVLTKIAGAAGNLLVDSAFFLVYTFIFFSRGAAMAETLQRTLPKTAAGGINVAGKALASSMLGVVATAVVQGAVGSLGTYVAGLPSPVLFFLAMAVASLIPGIGTLLVWGPAAAWLALTGNYLAAGGLTAWGILVIGSIDNFVRPFIASRFGQLDIIVAILGSLGGLALFGFTGVVLGPTLLAAGIEMLKGEPAAEEIETS